MRWWRLWAGGSATTEGRGGIAIPSRGQPKDPQEALSPALHLVALHCRHISHDDDDNNSYCHDDQFACQPAGIKCAQHISQTINRDCSLQPLYTVHDSSVAPHWLYSYDILQDRVLWPRDWHAPRFGQAVHLQDFGSCMYAGMLHNCSKWQ